MSRVGLYAIILPNPVLEVDGVVHEILVSYSRSINDTQGGRFDGALQRFPHLQSKMAIRYKN